MRTSARGAKAAGLRTDFEMGGLEASHEEANHD